MAAAAQAQTIPSGHHRIPSVLAGSPIIAYEDVPVPKEDTLKSVYAGKPLVDMVKLCYKANRPLLLMGKHGVGKSELLEQAAKELGINFICRDLSLMEPPDLVGMPKLEGNRTHYLPPAFLPTDGAGLLCFEELNRCPNYMRAPCLQLLTARVLNDYRLPPGWLPVAAINPSGGEYDVQELDPALLSRFVKVGVTPNRKEWCAWAKDNGIHEKVISYVDSDSRIFTDTSPRDWTYVSTLLHIANKGDVNRETFDTAVAGIVGQDRMYAFRKHYTGEGKLPAIMDLLSNYEKYQSVVKSWMLGGQTDRPSELVYNIKTLLQTEDNYNVLRGDRNAWKNMGQLLNDLPPDLCVDVLDYMTEQGYNLPPGVIIAG